MTLLKGRQIINKVMHPEDFAVLSASSVGRPQACRSSCTETLLETDTLAVAALTCTAY